MDESTRTSPAFALYGEGRIFPDVLHCETITARAARHDWKIARHRHPDLHQFFLIESGGATLRLSAEDRHLVPPVFVSMPCRIDHGFVFAAGTEGFVITVPVTLLGALSEDQLRRLQTGVVPPRAALLFDVIASRYADPMGARDTALVALVVALACDLVGGGPSSGDTSAALFDRFTTAVRNHATENWGVDDYAAHLGASATQLNRVVRAQADLSVMGAVQAHRLGKAARRLAYTRQPITTIAYDLGFSDPAYFARVFRKAMGESPRGYRKRFS